MNTKLARTLIRLYPAQWKSRYGEEFTAFLEDEAFTAGHLFEVTCSAVIEQIRHLGGSMRNSPESAINLATVSYLAAIAGGINLVASIDDSQLVGVMHTLPVPNAAWSILAIGGVLAGICVLVAGTQLYGGWFVNALCYRKRNALKVFVAPIAATVLLFLWGAASLLMTRGKWIASPWAILPQGDAPVSWPDLHFRWVCGAIYTILFIATLLAIAVSSTKISPVNFETLCPANHAMRTRMMRWTLLILAISMVAATSAIFAWGADLSLRVPELLHNQFGLLGSTVTVSWALSLLLFGIATIGVVTSARQYFQTTG